MGSAAYQGTTRAFTASGKVKLENDAAQGKLSAKAEGDASLFKTDHHAQYASPSATIAGKEVATVDLKANATVLVGVTGSAEAGVNWNSKDAGLKGKANVFAGIEAKGDASMDNRVLGVKTAASTDGYARAGAEASAEGSLGKDGMEAKAGAFAGAKAGGNLKSNIAGIGVGVEGEGWAGQGGEAELSAKMDDGKFKFKTSLGASPIVGGKAGFNIEVDPTEVAKLADLSDEIDELVEAIKANEQAQADYAQAVADANAIRDQILAQTNLFTAEVNSFNSQINDVGNSVLSFLGV
ncbi:hypothetical protein ETAA8_05910 [Anatilimnocola aggregata]|uniref:Uncharacterized protein n=1 Tax=Anatilimnocola aggregata TaxID=2528021 RepID=A0A517Y5X0_9BACT|nr:hypothetical protein [Anatilimnocola aggregata]QDU25522.1 hypothetical protein ETAA8_05910 [Anatilimnocola aggregata]